MKDSRSRNTDLLDNDDDQLDQSIDFGQITDLKGASIVLDLLGNWHTRDEAETANPSQYINASELIDHLLESKSCNVSSADSPTYVPERELVGSLFADSAQSQGSDEAPVRRLRLPGTGRELFGFHLQQLLGAGSFAKVYLANQGGLANRQVVLKVSAIEGTEPQTLAQLQHTHVVPIYSVHEDPDLGLRAVCMPYFGGAALSKVLHEIWRSKTLPANGQTLLTALKNVGGPSPAPSVGHMPTPPQPEKPDADNPLSVHTARNIIARMSYVQAAVWIVGRLAEGLHHSHVRNVVHRDIKPSNILLSEEAQPLLLDFNVSQLIDCDPDDASLGGTIAYMAPEHLRAAIARDSASLMLVDHRSDVYSLGLVLYEILTGVSPFERATNATLSPEYLGEVLAERERSVPSLKKQAKLDIPWSLESIVRKSLATDPKDRYETAAHFAEDLNRFLQDHPLKYAPELSRREQVEKWLRRHPRFKTTVMVTVAALMLIIPGGIALGTTRHDLALSKEQISQASAVQQAVLFENATVRALSMANIVSQDADQLRTSINNDSLRAGVEECRKTLALFSVLDDPDWQNHGHWRYFDFGKRRALGEKVRQLLLVLAGGEIRTADKPQQAAAHALELLQAAEQIQGLAPSSALLIDRARYLRMCHKPELAEQVLKQAEQTPARTAHDKYMLAEAYARQDNPESLHEAIRLLNQSIEMDATHYWSFFQRALCWQQLHENLLAATDMGTCIGLSPKSSWAHFNLGYLQLKDGRNSEAVISFTEALKHAPDFQSAYLNRGMALIELQEFQRALHDFDALAKLGRHDDIVTACRALALEGLGRSEEADKEFKVAFEKSRQIPGSPIDRISWTYAFAVADRAPQIAHDVFEEILKSNPSHPQALYGRGMLLMRNRDLKGAVQAFDEAIKADPTFMPPMRFRAIAMARNGDLQSAAIDSDECVRLEPTNPESYYTAACVAALSARRTNDISLRDLAIENLRMSLVHVTPKDRGAWRERALDDEDLITLRDDPAFQELTGNKQQPEQKKAKET